MDDRKLVENLKKEVYKARPIFGRIITKHGKKSLYDYAKKFFDIHIDANLESRRPICLLIVKREVEKRLGTKVAEEVERQLLKKPLVSTTDHHSIIDHPFWVNTNIITALHYSEHNHREEQNHSSMKYLIVFSFASVSLNNASGFPRGILFHGGDNGEGPLIRLPILPDKWKMRTVYSVPSYTKADLDRAKLLLEQKKKEGLITERRCQLIYEKVFSELEHPYILEASDFCEQITRLNFRLWPKLFSTPDGMQEIPDLIYIEAETMTREILLREVLQDTSCLLFKMLFDKATRKLVFKYFEGIPGTFSRKKGWGTFFFWTFNEKGQRVQLMLDGANLVSKDGNTAISMDPESIQQAFREKKIFPSMMLVYLTLSLHYGFKCLGGFSQVHDLTKMKKALLHVLIEMGKFREIHSVCRIATKELSGDGMVLTYIENAKGELTPSTGIDLLLAEKKLSYEDYRKISTEVSLEEMIGPMLPEMYTVLYPSYERKNRPEKELTPEGIMNITGLQNKITSILTKHKILGNNGTRRGIHSGITSDRKPESLLHSPQSVEKERSSQPILS